MLEMLLINKEYFKTPLQKNTRYKAGILDW